tara:strand:+ start:31537 stop:32433 length:897 start_codon:yes stop_codon:yes gene_type:complete
MGNNILKARNIIKKYENHLALDDVSISIPKGSIYGLLGPNGAGKSTLMKIINQITAPDCGEVFLNGERLQRKHISRIGYLPEERGLYKKMKVGEQSLYLAQLKGLSKKDASNKLKYWFEKLDILKWWNKKVEELSKGMAQKIQFAVTVIHNPDLLIFDEPFSGFDPLNTAIIRNEILELKKQGVSIIFSTHRMESVEEICDEITLINNGKSILQGEINSVKNNFKNNTFEFECNSENLVLENFTDLKQYGNRYSVVIPEGKNSKDLINEILKHTDIHYFKEKIPSMEEIFIKTINNNG